MTKGLDKYSDGLRVEPFEFPDFGGQRMPGDMAKQMKRTQLEMAERRVPKNHRVVIGGYPMTTEDEHGNRYCWCNSCEGGMISGPAMGGIPPVGLPVVPRMDPNFCNDEPVTLVSEVQLRALEERVAKLESRFAAMEEKA